MWRKENPYALVVEMQTVATTMEKSLENPQKKLKIEPPSNSAC